MAVPMWLPEQDEIELDLVLEQLLMFVRNIQDIRRLQRLRRMAYVRRYRAQQEPAPTADTPIHHPEPENLLQLDITLTPNNRTPIVPAPRQDNLPDLLNDIANCRTPKPSQMETESETSTSASWMQTGADLRHIADAFEELRTPEENANNRRKSEPKDLNLLSTLCPVLINTVWPALAFVLGWSLFTQKR